MSTHRATAISQPPDWGKLDSDNAFYGDLPMPETPPVRSEPNQPNLTGRETEVLSLLSLGLRNRAIAEKLFVGEETIKTHLKNIYRKLGVNGRGEAIAWALRDPEFSGNADSANEDEPD
jgi:DNA-binding NarL/FixJ family response regulator